MGIIQKKPWENHKNLNLGFRTLTLSPLSPYILGPNLFAYKLGFCYDPSPSIWANDPNSALFLAGFPKHSFRVFIAFDFDALKLALRTLEAAAGVKRADSHSKVLRLTD